MGLQIGQQIDQPWVRLGFRWVRGTVRCRASSCDSSGLVGSFGNFTFFARGGFAVEVPASGEKSMNGPIAAGVGFTFGGDGAAGFGTVGAGCGFAGGSGSSTTCECHDVASMAWSG